MKRLCKKKKKKEEFIVFAILSSAGEIESLFTINRGAPYLSTGHSGDRYRIRYTSHSSLSTCSPDVNYLPTIPDTTTTNQTFLFPTRESPFIFPYTRVYILWTGGLHFSIPGNDENSAGGRIVRYPTLRVYTRHEGIDIRPRVLYRNVNALVKHEYSSGGERIVSTKYRGLFRVPTRVEVYKWTRVRISSETTPRRLGGNGGASSRIRDITCYWRLFRERGMKRTSRERIFHSFSELWNMLECEF